MAQPNVYPRFLKAGTETITVYPRFLVDSSALLGVIGELIENARFQAYVLETPVEAVLSEDRYLGFLVERLAVLAEMDAVPSIGAIMQVLNEEVANPLEVLSDMAAIQELNVLTGDLSDLGEHAALADDDPTATLVEDEGPGAGLVGIL